MFVTILKRQLGNSRFVQLAQSFRNHCVVLFLRRARERQIEPEIFCELKRDSAVFGGVRRREETTVIAVLHVFAISLQNARRRAGLSEDFAQHREIEPERVTQPQTFGQAGGVDVHDHVDERFHFRRFARLADVTNGRAEFFQNRLRAREVFLLDRRTSGKANLRAPA